MTDTPRWPEHRECELCELWAAGHTSSEIGRRMHITKDAVVGKAHRLKLALRPSPIRRSEAPPGPPPESADRAPLPAGHPTTWACLSDQPWGLR
jgi:GcrA cell cycle regulator